MSARRCSKKASLISPVSGVSATSGPAARVAFSVKRMAMVFPSEENLGEARKPLTLVRRFAGPPGADCKYSCDWPGLAASERKAMRLLSGDQAMSLSARGDAEAVTFRAGVFPSSARTKMAELPESAPDLPRSASTQATFLPSGESATWSNEAAALTALMACSMAGETFSFSTSFKRFSTACLEVLSRTVGGEAGGGVVCCAKIDAEENIAATKRNEAARRIMNCLLTR